jgi:hypothetical protein
MQLDRMKGHQVDIRFAREPVTTPANPIPDGVEAIARLFAICGMYLAMAGLVNLIRPGAFPLSFVTPLLLGLESYGLYMLFLGALVGCAVAWGLWKLNNIVRHIAQLIAIAGIVILIPYVSTATVMVKLQPLVLGGLGIIVRVIVTWNLSREEAAEAFHRRP